MNMELFILVILAVFIGFIVACVCMDRYEMNQNIKKKCLKSNEELLMENDGDDPCADGQVIIVRQRFCESQSWIIEDKK